MALQKIPGRAIQLDSQANSDVMYFDGTDWVRLPKGEAGEVLTVDANAIAPQWATSWGFPGTIRGYCATGNTNPNGTGEGPKAIDRWSFTTDGNSTDVGDVTLGRHHSSGQSSETHGYISGSYSNGPITLAIDRWSFDSEGNAVDHGDLAIQTGQGTGQSSETHGYHSSGRGPGVPDSNHIQKFAFASTGSTNNALDIGNLTVARNCQSGTSSSTHGYCCGGYLTGTPSLTVIDKFAYATDSDATDVGDVDSSSGNAAGTSSLTHGYIAGGSDPVTSNIRKYSFASDGDSVDGGADLSRNRHALTGCSSETFGYSAAGYNGSPGSVGATNIIEKWSVSTDSNATDVGDLVGAKWYATPVGSQV